MSHTLSPDAAIPSVDLAALARRLPTESPLHLYFKEIAAIPPLSSEEEAALFTLLRAGNAARERLSFGVLPEEPVAAPEQAVKDGERAKEKLLEAHLRLVVAVVQAYEGPGIFLLDLIAEGNLGLIHAVEHFDPAGEEPFSRFAARCIRYAILPMLRPGSLPDEPHLPEPAEEWALPAEESDDSSLLALAREGHLPLLPQRERDILELRLGLKDGRRHTRDEVAEIFGITRHRVQQLETKALRKLRYPRHGGSRRVLKPFEE